MNKLIEEDFYYNQKGYMVLTAKCHLEKVTVVLMVVSIVTMNIKMYPDQNGLNYYL